jgi:hypothetical protein|tara:strand:+ start:266 stop:502 length:237 start_codon:yes stop_codon:yes gene_type:complete
LPEQAVLPERSQQDERRKNPENDHFVELLNTKGKVVVVVGSISSDNNVEHGDALVGEPVYAILFQRRSPKKPGAREEN